MSIAIKLKKCAGCNQLKHIWKSHGKEKYCQQCWYSVEKPKSISPVSAKRQGEMDEYGKRRIAYLAMFSTCQAGLVECTGQATEIHHKAGRVGELYTKVSNFLAVCRNCHRFIEENPEEAKELGLSESRLNQ
jgi:RNA polymerase subunit RPABC4/transcription elongation factor Spt4